jgi:hypothetical protein
LTISSKKKYKHPEGFVQIQDLIHGLVTDALQIQSRFDDHVLRETLKATATLEKSGIPLDTPPVQLLLPSLLQLNSYRVESQLDLTMRTQRGLAATVNIFGRLMPAFYEKRYSGEQMHKCKLTVEVEAAPAVSPALTLKKEE